MKEWIYKNRIILFIFAFALLALGVFVVMRANREIQTDVPKGSYTTTGVMDNPNKDLWLTRATDLAATVKRVETDDDCKRLVFGICGSRPPTGRSDEITWRDACACEVSQKICLPAVSGKKDEIRKKRGERGYALLNTILDEDQRLGTGSWVIPWS